MKKLFAQIIANNRHALSEMWPKGYLEEVRCPICGTQTHTHVYPSYYPRLVCCHGCNLLYTNPRLKIKYIQELYGKEYFNNDNSELFGYHNYLADEVKITKTFKRRLQSIEKLLPKHGRVLDLGCAAGFFLNVARNHGWKPTGVEISPFAASFAQNNLKLNVLNTNLEKITFPERSFELITLWDVIEHLPNPVDTIKKAVQWLTDDGMIVFTTPDVGSIPARLTKHRWIGYKLSDEHLTYFSPNTIKLLCDKAGLTIIKTNHVGKYVSFTLFAERIGLYSKTLARLLKVVENIIPTKLHFYLSAFDIICIYARKK